MPLASPTLRGGKNCSADKALVTVYSPPSAFPSPGLSVLEAAQGLCLSSTVQADPRQEECRPPWTALASG